MKGEADPSLHNGDHPKRHLAIAVGEAIIEAVWSDLYIGRDLVHVPKESYGSWVS